MLLIAFISGILVCRYYPRFVVWVFWSDDEPKSSYFESGVEKALGGYKVYLNEGEFSLILQKRVIDNMKRN